MRMVYSTSNVHPTSTVILDSGHLSDLDPQSAEYLQAASAVDALYPWPDNAPWVRANMVSSLDGRAQGSDGLTASISNAADKFIFARLRATCDVILVGAGTVRAENYRPARTGAHDVTRRSSRGQRPAPIIAIVSKSLRLDLDSDLFTRPATDPSAERPIVITTADSDLVQQQKISEVATVVVAGETDVDLTEALTLLNRMKLTRVLCEGGPTLLNDLVAGDHLDELDLTLSPQLIGSGISMLESHPATPEANRYAPTPIPRTFDLSHIIESESMLMLRYISVAATT
jgi:riboflavin-specific deaminase-like protein